MFNKNNKVLFIIHDLYQDDNRFPLGPAYLAAVLNKNGATAEAYCMDVFHFSNDDLARHLDKNEYDLIGVGFLAARFEETVRELCRVINAHKKNAWLILGGHGPSPIPEYILRETGADMIAIGEAENTIIDLLSCKLNNGSLADVPGIAYLDKGEYRYTGPAKIVKQLDDVPFPLWEIFPMEKYTACSQMYNQGPEEKSFSIIAGRGCINRCNFCYRMEKGIRLRSVANIMEELKLLYSQYGVNCFFFEDELFVFSKARLKEFNEALKEAGLKIKYLANARVDIIDEELVELLKETGCQFVNIGFESSSDRVLELMKKNATSDQNIRAMEIINKAGGIGMGLNFIWNNLGDTEESLKENVRLIKKYNTYYQCRTIRPVTPYPGADLYYTLIEMGKIDGPKDFFLKFKNSDLIFENVMDIPLEKAYDCLLAANTELIRDHYSHKGENVEEGEALIRQLDGLYSGKITTFRGTRHYNREEK